MFTKILMNRFMKNYLKILIIILVVAAVGVGVFYFIKDRQTKRSVGQQTEQKSVPALSQEAYPGVVVNRVYVSGDDIFIEGDGLLNVIDEHVENSTCIYYGNDAGFRFSFNTKIIELRGLARCLPKTKPNFMYLSWLTDDQGGKKDDKFLIEE